MVRSLDCVFALLLCLASASPSLAGPLTIGLGDGSLTVGVDPYGSFGLAMGGSGTTDASYNPIGPLTTAGTVGASSVAIRIPFQPGHFTSVTYLTTGTIEGKPGSLGDPGFTATSPTSATSQFLFGGLDFELVQTLQQIPGGVKLTQTYAITTSPLFATQFELIRYFDGDLRFDDSPNFQFDGGGRLGNGAALTLFQVEQGATTSGDPTFVGITSQGGTVPASNRFEISEFCILGTETITGFYPLSDSIQLDTNSDGFIDFEYDVTMALRNEFYDLQPGETAIYTTETFWGSSSAAVPEPSTFTIMTVIGTCGGLAVWWRKRKRNTR